METIKDKTPSEQADEIVEMFQWHCLKNTRSPIETAILHVTGIIEVLETADCLWHIKPHYQQILTILKEKL